MTRVCQPLKRNPNLRGRGTKLPARSGEVASHCCVGIIIDDLDMTGPQRFLKEEEQNSTSGSTMSKVENRGN